MSNKKRVLTGITTSGVPHIGNLAGAILPAIKASKDKSTDSFLFLADYHSLIKVPNWVENPLGKYYLYLP